MKQRKILHKFEILKFIRFAGIIFGLVIGHFLTVNINAQVGTSRPGGYNTPINYGRTRSEGIIGEDRAYESYQRRVNDYYQAKRRLINEEWLECNHQAKNPAQSKGCDDTSVRKIIDLEMDVKRISNAAFTEHFRRKDLIVEYWNKRK